MKPVTHCSNNDNTFASRYSTRKLIKLIANLSTQRDNENQFIFIFTKERNDIHKHLSKYGGSSNPLCLVYLAKPMSSGLMLKGKHGNFCYSKRFWKIKVQHTVTVLLPGGHSEETGHLFFAWRKTSRSQADCSEKIPAKA
ncbi:hypothetical protein AVEN_81385-1 [Araneus ventricosus]|uniref:Uncharacterized protein n=1 Tax=Araneus ventricosus TaxID=182803 RepID=A0A4Y2B5Y0_ARAVE|nr:hypothetical protein AVEN_81385-1 [Araneus ventricosus]